jgi:hypothetical protein
MNDKQTYTQVIDEKTGEIKYVPNTPPTPPEALANMAGDKNAKASGERPKRVKIDPDAEESLRNDIFSKLDLKLNDKLTDVLVNLAQNAKRLRYDRRLETGKLDGRRLTAYKTSHRLFKKKAIKDKHYQFTFLLDTSGSMGHSDDDGTTRMQVACEVLVQTMQALEDPQINIRSSVIGMNNAVMLLKDFGETLDTKEFVENVVESICGDASDDEDGDKMFMGGTSEMIAYREALDYIRKNTSNPKTTNVVIVLSDGAPGAGFSPTPVYMDGNQELREVELDDSQNSTSVLRAFWERNNEVMCFGLGIQSRAQQIPVSRQINTIKELPHVMSNLLTELMI